jgi:hypothetical protein
MMSSGGFSYLGGGSLRKNVSTFDLSMMDDQTSSVSHQILVKIEQHRSRVP